MKLAAAGVLWLALAAGPALGQADPRAWALSGIETRVAVATPGTRVCRALPVGIGLQDWIRGTTIGIEGDVLRVRIDAPGRFGQSIAGVALAKDVEVRDAVRNWQPCN